MGVAIMDVFSAFPNSIVSNVWMIGAYQRGSVVGNVFDISSASLLNVIIDEGDVTNINASPNAETIDADLLLYVKPSELPTTNPRALASGYLVYDSVNKDFFAVVNASIGKNQDTGEIEHIELLLKQTDSDIEVESA